MSGSRLRGPPRIDGSKPNLHPIRFRFHATEPSMPVVGRIRTGFDIGSLVKPITGADILKLEEHGQLSTSDTLARFFPDAPTDKRDITLMQVLTHTAGMQDVFGGDYQVVSRDWIFDKIMNAPLIAAPRLIPT